MVMVAVSAVAVVMPAIMMMLMSGHVVMGVSGDFFNQTCDVLLQFAEILIRLSRIFFHVQTPIDFNLQ
jgi:hypothetical protein